MGERVDEEGHVQARHLLPPTEVCATALGPQTKETQKKKIQATTSKKETSNNVVANGGKNCKIQKSKFLRDEKKIVYTLAPCPTQSPSLANTHTQRERETWQRASLARGSTCAWSTLQHLSISPSPSLALSLSRGRSLSGTPKLVNPYTTPPPTNALATRSLARSHLRYEFPGSVNLRLGACQLDSARSVARVAPLELPIWCYLYLAPTAIVVYVYVCVCVSVSLSLSLSLSLSRARALSLSRALSLTTRGGAGARGTWDLDLF